MSRLFLVRLYEVVTPNTATGPVMSSLIHSMYQRRFLSVEKRELGLRCSDIGPRLYFSEHAIECLSQLSMVSADSSEPPNKLRRSYCRDKEACNLAIQRLKSSEAGDGRAAEQDIGKIEHFIAAAVSRFQLIVIKSAAKCLEALKVYGLGGRTPGGNPFSSTGGRGDWCDCRVCGALAHSFRTPIEFTSPMKLVFMGGVESLFGGTPTSSILDRLLIRLWSIKNLLPHPFRVGKVDGSYIAARPPLAFVALARATCPEPLPARGLSQRGLSA